MLNSIIILIFMPPIPMLQPKLILKITLVLSTTSTFSLTILTSGSLYKSSATLYLKNSNSSLYDSPSSQSQSFSYYYG